MADYITQTHVTGKMVDMLPDIIKEVFPLNAKITSHNADTYEVGTSVTPSVTLEITRRGVDVADEATVVVSPSAGVTIAENHKGWSATAMTSGSKTFKTKVQQDGDEVDYLDDLKWSFSNYRYRGVLNSTGTITETIIKGLATKEFSVSSSLKSTSLAANKSYLFAVKGTNPDGTALDLVVRHAQTGGPISGCTTGVVSVKQENYGTTGLSNSYSYVVIPASSRQWNFTINFTSD